MARYPFYMNASMEFTTVYRSADTDAEENAQAVRDTLAAAGFHPQIVGDDTPGVVEGTYEVRVPASEAGAAEALVAQTPDSEYPERVDPSHDLDLVPVAKTDGTTGEMEATGIQSILDANGISALIVGNSTLPNLGFEVRVSRNDEQHALEVIREARAAGPEAAVEGEQASEV
jgi:hypothetical protein